MRITFYKPPSKPHTFGGNKTHFSNVAKQLHADGHEVGVIHDVAPEEAELKWFPNTRWGAWQAAKWTDVFYRRLRISSGKPGSLPRSLKWFQRMNSVPLVWEINSPVAEGLILGDYDDAEATRREAAAREVARGVSAAFCVSRELVRYSQDQLNIPNSHYVPNGADCDHFRPDCNQAAELPIIRDRPVIFWIGGGKLPWEGDRLIVELARRLHQQRIRCSILLAGTERKDVEYPPNLRHLGRISYASLPGYMAQADICLCLYNLAAYGNIEFYNSPIKLYEYMAAGKAIVANDVGEIRRAIEHGTDGLLVDSAMEEIIEAIKALISNATLRDALGRAARKKAVEFYNWKRVTTDTLSVLHELLSNGTLTSANSA